MHAPRRRVVAGSAARGSRSRAHCLRDADTILAFRRGAMQDAATRIGPPSTSRPDGDMSDQTYDDGRARNLEGLLRALADRIRELDAQGRLLANPAELTRLIGDVKSELFHYEVRATYDTPEVADSRRIVNEAIKRAEQGESWQEREWTEDGDDAPEW